MPHCNGIRQKLLWPLRHYRQILRLTNQVSHSIKTETVFVISSQYVKEMELHVAIVTSTKAKRHNVVKSDGTGLFWRGFRWGPFWFKSGSTIFNLWALWQQEVTHAVTDKNLWRNGCIRKQAKEVIVNLETATLITKITTISTQTLPSHITLIITT